MLQLTEVKHGLIMGVFKEPSTQILHPWCNQIRCLPCQDRWYKPYHIPCFSRPGPTIWIIWLGVRVEATIQSFEPEEFERSRLAENCTERGFVDGAVTRLHCLETQGKCKVWDNLITRRSLVSLKLLCWQYLFLSVSVWARGLCWDHAHLLDHINFLSLFNLKQDLLRKHFSKRQGCDVGLGSSNPTFRQKCDPPPPPLFLLIIFLGAGFRDPSAQILNL